MTNVEAIVVGLAIIFALLGFLWLAGTPQNKRMKQTSVERIWTRAG